MKFPKAVLFDHDGVLVASERLHRAAWAQLLPSLGLPYDEKAILQMVGKTAPEILARLLDRYRPGWTPQEFDLNALALRKNDFYLKAAREGLQIYPGVRELLADLKCQGVKIAVVSNAKARELQSTYQSLGLSDQFDIVLSRDDVPRPKPDPSAYLEGALRVGVAPSDCLAIEDSPTGLESALLGGIPGAGVTTSFPTSVLEHPVAGRRDLAPVWIGGSIVELHDWLLQLTR